jgi:hypothetical protein
MNPVEIVVTIITAAGGSAASVAGLAAWRMRPAITPCVTKPVATYAAVTGLR